MVSRITTVQRAEWNVPDASPEHAVALEAGDVLFFQPLAFPIEPSELDLFSPRLAGASKNVSFDPRRGRLAGTSLEGAEASRLRDLVARFSASVHTFARALLPAYGDRIELGRTSFRPVEIAGRASSWRKDDTRLHIDSFPATPVGGQRILRVFSNVNPAGRARSWRVGEDFESVARRFAARLRMPLPGSAAVLRLLRVTKSPRSPYDALMLQLHDLNEGGRRVSGLGAADADRLPPGLHLDGVHRPGEPRGHGRAVPSRADVPPADRGDAR